MRAFLSMSSTLNAFIRGEFSSQDLEDRAARFYFGCTREHVLTPGTVPCEALWSNKRKTKSPEPVHTTEIPENLIDKENLPAVRRFIEIVRAADELGHVRWKSGNLHEVAATLDPQTDCFFCGEWRKAADVASQAEAAPTNGSTPPEFRECPTCAAKPGSPTLCDDCLRRRAGQPTKHTITITVEGGVIQHISAIPRGVRLVVHDYDVDRDDDETTKTDANGDCYFEGIWEADPAKV